jgi:predicted MFS family arabinose efflux permease
MSSPMAETPLLGTPRSRSGFGIVIPALGVGQIFAWGSSYYLPAAIARSVSDATGWSLSWVVGALSIGLLVSGLVSPRVGRLIERYGGRPVLAASAVLLAVGLLGMGLSSALPTFVAAWIVIGLGMGAGLYDPAFSALGRLYGEQARSAITQVTLIAGFSSTVCWPLSAFLVEHAGWRGTCFAYAGILVIVVLPLYLFGLPREPRRDLLAHAEIEPIAPVRLRADHRVVFGLLAAGFTLASVIMTVVSVHLLALLQARGLTLIAAVSLGALIGPSQVGARFLEMMFGRRTHPIWSLLASTILVAVGVAMLLWSPGLAATGIVLYGAGQGIRSIARGTVPLALFGPEGYAILMGRLAMPTLIAQAASPSVGAWLLDGFGASTTLTMLLGAAVLNIALVLLLIPFALRRPITAP